MSAGTSDGPCETRGSLVTVIMPVYNAGAYLRPAVESVLAQTYAHWELVLIDDGSTDGCVEALADIEDPRIRRFRQTNSGKPAAMNRGLALARGEFYALQDADDLSHPARIERQAACLEANPQVAGVFCGHEMILDGRALAATFRAKTVEECARDIEAGRMPGHDPTAMYRLSMVREIDYSEDLAVVEGLDYIMRVGERFPLMVLGECLYGYRIHAQSLTKQNPSHRNRMIQAAFDRMYDRRGEPRRPAPGLDRGPGGRLRDADNDLVSHFTQSVADQVLAGRRAGAVGTGFACWRLHPGSVYYAKPLLYALTPRRLMKLYRRARERRAELRLVREAAARRESAG
jgi:glycosyltransferase involved in cell wall biosynthesis